MSITTGVQRSRLATRTVCTAVLLGGLLGDYGNARACPPLSSIRSSQAALVPHFIMIPAGGDLAVACSEPCVPTADPVHVEDWETGLALSGEVIRSGVNAEGLPWFVFRPTIPLSENQGVSVTIQTDGKLEGEDFGVMPSEGELDPLDVEFSANSVSYREPFGLEVCCAETECSGPEICFTELDLVRPALSLYVRTQTVAVSQWFFYATFGTDEEQPVAEAGPFLFHEVTQHVFEPSAAKYCYTLQAEPIAGGAKVQFARACIDRDLDAEYGEVMAYPSFKQNLELCQAPPEGHEQPWCDVHRECQEDDGNPACAICEKSSPSDPVDAGASAPRDDAGAFSSGDGSLCSAAPWYAQRSPTSSTFCFSLLVGALAGRRRKSEPKGATAGGKKRAPMPKLPSSRS